MSIRWDRWITLNVAQPVRRTVLAHDRVRLPILMYHSISNASEPGVSPYYQVNTSPAVFRDQMAMLAAQGYRAIDLAQGLDLLQRPAPEASDPAEKHVVITFDDGFRDFYTDAFPVLDSLGFTASVFLPTAFIQRGRRSFKQRECLTWDEVCELRKCGIDFGSHTVSHPLLVELSWPEIGYELRDSKAEIEQRLGEAVTTFSYPYAFPQTRPQFVTRFQELLVENGYSCCATTKVGRAAAGEDPFAFRRLPVNSLDDEGLLRAKLEGSYDWLAFPQTVTKQIKQWISPSSLSTGTRPTTSRPV